MSAHTPGPWEVRQTSRRANAKPCITTADGGYFVAGAVASGGSEPVNETIEANAALIAAAPDLLRVVDGLLQVCHRGPDESKGGANQESYADWKQRMISEAIDAIAKARGSR